MAATAQSVKKVNALTGQMLALYKARQDAKLGNGLPISDTLMQQLKAEWLADLQTLRDAVLAETVAW